MAAVERNGKWALVNDKLKLITDFVYDDILMDDYGFCSKYETIVARVGSEFVFLNTDGKQSSLQGFEQAAIPASKDGLIAIMNRGKWGFADKNGNIVIQEQYEEAKSFSLGLAPIKQGDLWGYVNTDGRLVTEMEFYEANPFSKDGAATVKSRFSWSIITLCKYDT